MNAECSVTRTINVCMKGQAVREWDSVQNFVVILFYFVLAFGLQNSQQVCPLEIKFKTFNGFLLVKQRSKDILCEHLCWKYLKCECHPSHTCICTAGPHKVNECSQLLQSFCHRRRFSKQVDEPNFNQLLFSLMSKISG